jgi:hypothetical protein
MDLPSTTPVSQPSGRGEPGRGASGFCRSTRWRQVPWSWPSLRHAAGLHEFRAGVEAQGAVDPVETTPSEGGSMSQRILIVANVVITNPEDLPPDIHRRAHEPHDVLVIAPLGPRPA